MKGAFVGTKELWHYQDARYNDKDHHIYSCYEAKPLWLQI